jgi:hypothetical protein
LMFSSTAARGDGETTTHRGLTTWLSKNNLRYFLSTKGFRSRFHTPDHVVRRVTPLETRLLASIFGTLLSSQGSDAHRVPVQWTRRRGNPSNLPACFMGVKSVIRSTRRSLGGRIRSRLALGGRTHSTRLPDRFRPPAGAFRSGVGRPRERQVEQVSARGTGLLRETLVGVHPVVSVPP